MAWAGFAERSGLRHERLQVEQPVAIMAIVCGQTPGRGASQEARNLLVGLVEGDAGTWITSSALGRPK